MRANQLLIIGPNSATGVRNHCEIMPVQLSQRPSKPLIGNPDNLSLINVDNTVSTILNAYKKNIVLEGNVLLDADPPLTTTGTQTMPKGEIGAESIKLAGATVDLTSSHVNHDQ